jgi:hypothetical protein
MHGLTIYFVQRYWMLLHGNSKVDFHTAVERPEKSPQGSEQP